MTLDSGVMNLITRERDHEMRAIYCSITTTKIGIATNTLYKRGYTTALGADITQYGYVHYCIASVSAIEQIIQIYVRPEEMTVKLSRARNSPSGLLKDEVCTLKIL